MSESMIAQSSTLPPAQPVYVLRGHSAQIHALHFLRCNLRLLSGDAEGWTVLWNVTIRRPVAVWKPHNGPVIGFDSWEDDKIITHGRDHKLCVWQLREDDESTLSTVLPIDDAISERKQPWLLHSIVVNALNFCSFSICRYETNDGDSTPVDRSSTVLVATPGVQDGFINLTSLPGEGRVATIPNPKDTQTGMLMSVCPFYHKQKLRVFAGYESGHIALWSQQSPTGRWQTDYITQCHTQPVLSLDATLDGTAAFSSSADAIIAKHTLGVDGVSATTRSVQTKHAGQQSLAVRCDGKIFATAGWDGRVRVYSTKSLKELAVLKWHKEGCYAAAFAHIANACENVTDRGGDNADVVKRELTVSEQRTQKAKSTHWLAAGSKDGKISLWDIY